MELTKGSLVLYLNSYILATAGLPCMVLTWCILAWEYPRISHEGESWILFQPVRVYTTVSPCIHKYGGAHTPASHPECCCQHNCYPNCAHLKLASCCQRSSMKILLTVYSFKIVQNDIHQIYLYIEIQLTSVGFAHTRPNKEPNNKSRNAVHCWVSVSEVNGAYIVH